MNTGEIKKLNLGCGNDIREGWINLDNIKLPGVDIVCDIEKEALPFADGTLDEIYAEGILEHVDLVPVLKELHRVLKPGGSLEIKVPHFTSRYNFIDPTHKRMFSFQTFEFFLSGARRDYYFDFHFSQIPQAKIFFETKQLPYNYLVEPLINISRRTKQIYEATFLSRLFPAADIIFKLIK
jgi:SAM-dependent methyltransferase